jgi:hypothetical protein
MTSCYELRWCEFDGGTAMTGPLSWAQEGLWSLVNLPGNYRGMDFFLDFTVPCGIGVETAISCLRHVLVRNSALRTRICSDEYGRTSQRILDSGRVPVHITEIPARPQPSTEIWRSLPDVPESYLVQALVGMCRGSVRLVSLRLSHALTDGWGADLLRRELATVLRHPQVLDDDHAASGSKTSLDLARFEHSADGDLIRARALDYVSTQLESAPATMFPPEPLICEQPRYWNLRLVSSRLLMALRRLVNGKHLTLSTPIVGVFAAIMAARCQLPSALIYVTSSNRALRGWRAFTGPMAQDVLLCVPVCQPALGALMDSAQGLILRAYQHAHYDPAAVHDRISGIQLRRGLCFDQAPWAAMINVRNTDTGPFHSPHTASPDLGYPGSEPSLRSFSSVPRGDNESCALFVDAIAGPSTVVLEAHLDTQAISVSESTAIMAAMEHLICELSLGNDVPIRDIPAVVSDMTRRQELSATTTGATLSSASDRHT